MDKDIFGKGSCYHKGQYYNELLPDYSWNGKSDEEFLEEHLQGIIPTRVDSALELACGAGRGTGVLAKFVDNITAVDKSQGMLSAIDPGLREEIRVVKDDMKDYLMNAAKSGELQDYDFIFSFWGIFYLVHQEFIQIDSQNKMVEVDYDVAFPRARDVVYTFMSNLGNQASGCFVHVRRDTDEQILNRNLWARWVNERYDPQIMTPSEIIFQEVMEELSAQGRLTYSIKDIDGTVTFMDMDHAIETFLNFHSKAYFNDKEYLPDVLAYLRTNLEKHEQEDGRIIMGAGLKIIDFGVKNG